MKRFVTSHILSLECVLHLSQHPRFLGIDNAHGNIVAFVEDDERPRLLEPWTVVTVGPEEPVPDRAFYFGSTFGATMWLHAYAYRGRPRPRT